MPKRSKAPLPHRLPSGQAIRLLSAPLFLATKLEAFRSRGAGDDLHHDMQDMVTLIDGRDSIVEEALRASPQAQAFLVDEFDALLSDPTFVERMSWHLAPQERSSRKVIVLERLRRMAGI